MSTTWTHLRRARSSSFCMLPDLVCLTSTSIAFQARQACCCISLQAGGGLICIYYRILTSSTMLWIPGWPQACKIVGAAPGGVALGAQVAQAELLQLQDMKMPDP